MRQITMAAEAGRLAGNSAPSCVSRAVLGQKVGVPMSAATTFASLGVPKPLVSALEQMQFHEPFEIQALTIPDALAGRDILGRAPTGSGKTLAFGLPVLAGLRRGQSGRMAPPPDPRRPDRSTKRGRPAQPTGLVLCPTRELAEQIRRELEPLADAVDRTILAVYGGRGFGQQLKGLSDGIDLLVACPGRLIDLINQDAVDLGDVDMVVVDEADRMADMGFLPDVRKLLDQTSPDRQTMLFSATLDREVKVLVDQYQHDPVEHAVAELEPDLSQLTHRFIQVPKAERIWLTADLVTDMGSTIVFVRTRHGADRVARQLKNHGVKAAPIHGGRSQPRARQRAGPVHRREGAGAGGHRRRRPWYPRRRGRGCHSLRPAGRGQGLRAPFRAHRAGGRQRRRGVTARQAAGSGVAADAEPARDRRRHRGHTGTGPSSRTGSTGLGFPFEWSGSAGSGSRSRRSGSGSGSGSGGGSKPSGSGSRSRRSTSTTSSRQPRNQVKPDGVVRIASAGPGPSPPRRPVQARTFPRHRVSADRGRIRATRSRSESSNSASPSDRQGAAKPKGTSRGKPKGKPSSGPKAGSSSGTKRSTGRPASKRSGKPRPKNRKNKPKDGGPRR